MIGKTIVLNDAVGETQSFAEEAEGETRGRKKWDKGTTGRKESNTLHVVFHLANATTPTTASSNCSDSALAVTLHREAGGGIAGDGRSGSQFNRNFDVSDDFPFTASEFGASTPCLVGRGAMGHCVLWGVRCRKARRRWER